MTLFCLVKLGGFIGYKSFLTTLDNYKGLHFENNNECKFFDPKTGAHFQYGDVVHRLSKIAQGK